MGRFITCPRCDNLMNLITLDTGGTLKRPHTYLECTYCGFGTKTEYATTLSPNLRKEKWNEEEYDYLESEGTT